MSRNAPEAWETGSLVDHYNTLFPFDEKEILAYLAPLELGRDDVFIDFGCGNGAALAVAARFCRRVIGVDVAEKQLEQAKQRLAAVPAARLLQVPFLDCRLEAEEPLTKGSSRKALHHLTDAEKIVFFRQIGPRFAPGARFVIEDAVFDFDRSELEACMPQVLADAATWYGERWPQVQPDFLITIRDEFATGLNAWTAALEAGGFRLARRTRHTCFLSHLTAIKEG
ncbi:MAG TPA: class I SAM-dependent methyltransferase [Candidatus Ozemobacteraceae bacterium]|nr:class I SAM-dependent methyltransferase [Candidatus Ozemobacteraceae bacterium]